jgi:hypothetical protein
MRALLRRSFTTAVFFFALLSVRVVLYLSMLLGDNAFFLLT